MFLYNSNVSFHSIICLMCIEIKFIKETKMLRILSWHLSVFIITIFYINKPDISTTFRFTSKECTGEYKIR